MPTKTITLGCALTADEYRKFKEICDKKGTYPSAAIRDAVIAWMERNENDGMGTA